MVQIRRLDASQPGFDREISDLTKWESVSDPNVESSVKHIIAEVAAKGDDALVSFTRKFDHFENATSDSIKVDSQELKASFDGLPEQVRTALVAAASRIESFHKRQKSESWQYLQDGVLLGQKVTPLDRVGIYVPGGQASYPSSVLMNAIPAKVAGVGQIVMVSPAPGGQINPVVLAAAHIAGVTEVFKVGGAQAVAALAYGTETVPRVDKIVGPGNSYVATAKQQVFGLVGIDMIAGPSEILVVCDGKTPADWIAMDLFSQAEHDADAQSILICPDASYLDEVQESINRLLLGQSRAGLIETSLKNRGAFILVNELDDAWDVVNLIAPEHLEVSVDEPEKYLEKIRHAGAIFLGRHTPEALGDYCAGPNHVLPTSGTARFFSPLGVYDFEKRSSIINVSEQAAQLLCPVADTLATSEGLQAHAESARLRVVKS